MCRGEKQLEEEEGEAWPGVSLFASADQQLCASKFTTAKRKRKLSDGFNCYFSLFAVNVTRHQLDDYLKEKKKQHNPRGLTHINAAEYTKLTGEQTCPESYINTNT